MQFSINELKAIKHILEAKDNSRVVKRRRYSFVYEPYDGFNANMYSLLNKGVLESESGGIFGRGSITVWLKDEYSNSIIEVLGLRFSKKIK